MYEVKRPETENLNESPDFQAPYVDNPAVQKTASNIKKVLLRVLVLSSIVYFAVNEGKMSSVEDNLYKCNNENIELKSSLTITKQQLDSYKKKESLNVQNVAKPKSRTKILAGMAQNCEIKIKFDNNDQITIAHLINEGKANDYCSFSPKIALSNFGKYAVFEDRLSESTSVIRLYSFDTNTVKTLDEINTEDIIDILFLTGDFLAVMYNSTETGKQELVVYDVNKFGSGFRLNKKTLDLPDFGKNYAFFYISAESLVVKTDDPQKFAIFSVDQYSF
jgi:hypothetical protein